jgi:eukaryotic-like serine/threonine-protein kinase
MAERIGRFEILSEISRSQSACIYKASDPENAQTVALKTVKLDLATPAASALLQRILQEAETTKPLNSHNIVTLYGAGDIDGQFCAAMEYVQGKSVSSMLARHERFSLWDLQDIARQTCQALDHAHAHQVVHYSLEPGKLMVSWDGTVKILGFGVSSINAGAAQASGAAPDSLHYMSPEQVRGEPLDARSNLFSLGAVLYEMVTGRKAFGGEDADQLRQEITVGMPVAPAQIIRKLDPGLSELIMKALAKTPAQRYQSGQDLLGDLEQCKESGSHPASVRKNSSPAGAPAEAQINQAPQTAMLGRKTAAAESAYSSSGRASLSAAWPEESDTGTPITAHPGNAGGRVRSFSEIDELPPLQELGVATLPHPEPEAMHKQPEAAGQQGSVFQGSMQAEKPAAPFAALGKRSIEEIIKTPPKLFLYSVAGALGIVLIVTLGIYSHVNSEGGQENTPATQAADAAQQSQTPAVQVPFAVQLPSGVQAAGNATPGKSVISITPKYARRKPGKVAPPAAPAIIPGQLTINSTPEGAQVLVDGHHNPAWLTPLNMAGLAPGQHLVSVSKPGYAPEMRTIDVASSSKSFLVVQLAQLGATAFVSSVPPGAQVLIDGRDTGHETPVEIPVDKPGSHSFMVRKQGYLESSSTAYLQAGQTFQFAPVLQALGMTDDIKIGGGRFKKIFGGGDTTGMGAVTVKTQPKGAQVAINRRVLDKTSPVEFYLNPGAYILDVTLTGYGTVHRVINVERGGKLAIDEDLERQ